VIITRSISDEIGIRNNHSIETFVFDASYFSLATNRFWYLMNPSCFLNSAVEFIQALRNVRRVKSIANRRQIVTFLQIDQWKQLTVECLRLNRVIIRLVDGGDFTQDAANIEQQLRHVRPGMIFRMKTGKMSSAPFHNRT
jgi:hypothetical protein